MKGLKPVDFKAVAAQGNYVYCYLRVDGSPYYVGIASNASRPFRVKCGQTRNVIRPIPGRPELIRVMRSGLTWEEAGEWEKFYIALYGRKDIGTGILRNRTAGGDGGVEQGPEALRKMKTAFRKANKIQSANHYSRSAARYGVTVEFWTSLSQVERRKVCRRYAHGVRGPEIFDNDRNFGHEKSAEARETEAAAKYGCSIEKWKTMSTSERAVVAQRFARGLRGEALFDPTLSVQERAAQKYGVPLADLQGLTESERRAFRAWWRRHKGTIEQWTSCRRS